MKNLVILFTLLMILFAVVLIHPYGFKDSLNSGIAIGLTESCQFGYEFRGTPGYFGYCHFTVDTPPAMSITLFEDSSFVVSWMDSRIVAGCLPFGLCTK